MHWNSTAAVAAMSSMLLVSQGTAIAQGTPEGGTALDLRLGQSLVYSDNLDFPSIGGEDGFRGETTVDLSYSSITRSDRFTFDLDTTLEQGTDDNDNPASSLVRLTYARQAANAEIDFGVSYRRVDLDDLEFAVLAPIEGEAENTEFDLVDVTLDGGLRDTLSANVGYDVGLKDPVQLSLDLTYRNTRYTDVADPDLDDNVQTRLRAEATFRIDPRINLSLNASQERRDVEDDEETFRTRNSFAIGGDFEVSRRTSASLRLTYDETETERTTGTTVTDGVGLTFGLDFEMRNGTAAFDLASRVGTNGRVNSLRVSRALSLRDDADLTLSFGLVDAEDQDLQPTYGLTYSQDFKRSQATINFSQSLGTNDDDDDVLRSRLAANYVRPLSDISALRLNASGSNSEVLGTDGEDRSSLALGVSYDAQLPNQGVWSLGLNTNFLSVSESGSTETENRYGLSMSYAQPLTQDWDVVSSLRFDQIDPDDGDTRNATTVSLGIERTFSWRP